VRRLLNQTSGLSRMSGSRNLYRRDLGGDALEREARALRTVRLARPPGTAFEYSNLNYALLGLLGGVPAVWHSGSTGDFHANIVLLPQERWGVVVLANGEDFLRSGRIDAIASGVTSLLVGRQPPPAPFERVTLILIATLAVAVLQVLAIARSVVLLRRWRDQPASAPRGTLTVARRVALPLALSLVLVLGWGIVRAALATLVVVRGRGAGQERRGPGRAGGPVATGPVSAGLPQEGRAGFDLEGGR
jgi:hypothetical protein